MERSDYPAIPASMPPGSSINILRDRVQKVTTLNAEIAGWLQERRRVEEAYIQGLMRLAKAPTPGENSELGIFRGPWSQIVNSSLALASSHSVFCRNLEREVERPIGEFMTTNREWSSFKTMESNLTTVANNITASEAAADKLKKKGKRAEPSRVAEAAAGIQSANNEWESQAPFVFEKLQAMDEARINHLKESLIKMQTMEVDTANAIAQAMEQTVAGLLDINTQDEIKSWALSKSGPGGNTSRERQRSRVGTGVSVTPSIPSVVTDDSGSMQSVGSNEKTHTGLGGNLRRLGTVLKGRGNRNSYVPPSPDSNMSSNTKPEGRLGVGRHFGFGSLSPNGSSNNLPSAPLQTSSLEPPDTANSSYSQGRNNQSDRGFGNTPSNSVPQSPARNDTPRTMLTPTINAPTEESQKDAEGYTIPPPKKDLIPEAFQDEDEMEENGGEPANPAFKVEIRNDIIPEESEEADAALSKVANTLRLAQTMSNRSRGRRDGRNTIYGAPDKLDINGFSNGDYSSALGGSTTATSDGNSPSLTIPEPHGAATFAPVSATPANSISPPIASQTLTFPSTDDVFSSYQSNPPPANSDFASYQPNLPPASSDSVSYQSPPVTDTQKTQEAVPTSTQTHDYSTPAPSLVTISIQTHDYSAPLPPIPQQISQYTSVSPIQEDVQSLPYPDSLPALSQGPQPLTAAALNASAISPLAPFKMSRQTTLASDAGSEADTHSVRSAHSVTSHGMQVMRHPDFHESGLSASIVESISVSFESGLPQKVSIIGEIALAHIAGEASSSSTDIIRLDQNSLVEKIAPNPAFVSSADQKLGEYSLNLSAIPRTAVAFKYQLRINETTAASCLPIIVIPVWKFEADQARLIISYKSNPLYLASRPGVTMLKNLVVLTGVEGVQALSCQSKPSGTFSRERSRIAWKIPEVKLSADDTVGSKLIARFTTEGVGRASVTEIRWEILGEEVGKNVGSGLGLEVLKQSGSEKDPFADDGSEEGSVSGEWSEVRTVRKLLSGRYTAS